MGYVNADTPGHNDPGAGRRLGIDVGTVRIGVAVSDRDARLATPVETVARITHYRDPDGADIDRLMDLIDEYAVVEIVIGLPRDLQGNGSRSVRHAREIAFRLKRRLKQQGRFVAIRFADERLTTVVAYNAMAAVGRSHKKSRNVIDQAAAVEILQSWLDARQRYQHDHVHDHDDNLECH
ncbi:Holliday junction resolvase RuvX [Corynebacterium sp. sy017]|uniref:Holliday junction resolvase RuvX n=1 Tax=unclassified Corynebacterium TaxID=2624378 RepID=UPI001186152A|nr:MULTISPECIES: Holliday junction resolvase RuvX [unclassified Corynebacterium]MBP3087702.1 Holliday junction resolvase RuvX [Corynebacterium sp. sy017]TSD92258.1 Holliday junction resolvase RuvX [Corynebacterium sp. SY003]